MITPSQELHFWVAMIASLAMTVMFVYAQLPAGGPSALNHSKYPSVLASFLLFGGNYILGLIMALFFVWGVSPSKEASVFIHIFLNNAGSLLIFLSAMIYAQGAKFNWGACVQFAQLSP